MQMGVPKNAQILWCIKYIVCIYKQNKFVYFYSFLCIFITIFVIAIDNIIRMIIIIKILIINSGVIYRNDKGFY